MKLKKWKFISSGWGCFTVMNIGEKSEPIVEDQNTINKFTDQKHISRRTLPFNLSSLSFENKRLERQFLERQLLEWKSIILMAFFCNGRILLIAFEFWAQPNLHKNMRIKYCKVHGFQDSKNCKLS